MAYNRKSPPRHVYYSEEEEETSSNPHVGHPKSVDPGTSDTIHEGTFPTNSRMTLSSNSAIVEQIWKDINASSDGEGAVEEGGLASQAHLQIGWTTDQASQRREKDGSFNVVKPPIDCPNWLCILLPCINHLASMKAFKAIQPDDAEVLRNGKWIRYDAASLVTGDVIRLEEGDLVPADCVVINAEEDTEDDLLVDLAAVTGQDRPKSISSTSTTRSQRQLFLGGRVVQGRATAMVTATGPQTLLATLIWEKRFPPKEPIFEAFTDGSGGSGIQLGNMS